MDCGTEDRRVELSSLGGSVTSFAFASMLPLCQQVVHDHCDREQGDPTKNDEDEEGIVAHFRPLPPSANAQPSRTNQPARPPAALTKEKGSSPRNCPKTSAPSARLAASGNLSISICRCSGVNPTIVDFMDEHIELWNSRQFLPTWVPPIIRCSYQRRNVLLITCG